MKIKSLVTLIAIAVASQISLAQTADEVINKHLEAMGGKENIGKLKTIKVSSQIEINLLGRFIALSAGHIDCDEIAGFAGKLIEIHVLARERSVTDLLIYKHAGVARQ